MSDFEVLKCNDSADELREAADDPERFAEMLDAIVFNEKADARREALEECLQTVDEWESNREAGDRVSDRVRALLEPAVKPCETCGGSGAVYETVTDMVLSADGRDMIPVDHNVSRACPACRR